MVSSSSSTSSSASSSSSSSTAGFTSYKVKITAKDLRMRTGPGTSYASKGYVKPGTYTIISEKSGWGKLSTNGYWVSLKYAKLSGKTKVKISASDLNMRTGAGIIYKTKGHVKKGTYTLKTIKNGWGQLASNGYWVSLNYVKLI